MIQLYNGDCLEVMDKLIEDGIKVDSIICDPPYGTTNCSWDSIIPFEEMWSRLNKLIKPNGAIVLFGSEPFSSALRMSNLKIYKYDWKWRKSKANGFLNVKKMPLKDLEDICVFYNKLPLYHPQGVIRVNKIITNNKGKKDNSKHSSGHNGGSMKSDKYIQKYKNYPKQVLDFKIEPKPLHNTQKPIPLMEYLIKTYTNQDELVLDFTMGSGTTGVACKQLNRKFIGIELDKDYFDIAQNRINESILGSSLEIKEDNLDEF